MDTEEWENSSRVKVAILLFNALCHGRATTDKDVVNFYIYEFNKHIQTCKVLLIKLLAHNTTVRVGSKPCQQILEQGISDWQQQTL